MSWKIQNHQHSREKYARFILFNPVYKFNMTSTDDYPSITIYLSIYLFIYACQLSNYSIISGILSLMPMQLCDDKYIYKLSYLWIRVISDHVFNRFSA